MIPRKIAAELYIRNKQETKNIVIKSIPSKSVKLVLYSVTVYFEYNCVLLELKHINLNTGHVHLLSVQASRFY